MNNMQNRYMVIALNLDKVERALKKEWPDKHAYSIMRQFVGTEKNPPKLCFGDALVIRDVLILHGCVFFIDFYIKKIKDCV